MRSIPCTLMRSGTSKGPFFNLHDLPTDPDARAKILLRILGSPDKNQIDGIGGAAFVTSKVVMVKPSTRPGIDVDYLFAQVMIEKPVVDTKPTCGNMMAGVGPFAIEKGWVKAKDPETKLMIYNYNTKATIEVIISTPAGKVNYTVGDTKIDGVPGTAAPILMNYFNVIGGTTGKLFPTGKSRDVIKGVDVSVVDAGNLMILLKAVDLGLEGTEDRNFFETNTALMHKIEAIRLEAGVRAGLGDVSQSVLPKVGLLSKPRNGGTVKSQYLTPHALHPAHAVSGAICIAIASKASDTTASDLAVHENLAVEKMFIEHPSGLIPVQLELDSAENGFKVLKAGVLRTARKLMEGLVYF